MKLSTIKQIGMYAAIAFAIWALLYGFYWHDRTNHSIFWGDAAVNWIGDVVMLQWVKSYQALLGGILTLAAGTAVVIAALVQRSHAVADRQTERQQQQVSLLNEALTLFEKCTLEVRRRQFDRARQTLDVLDGISQRLASSGAIMPSGYPYLISAIRARFEWIEATKESADRKEDRDRWHQENQALAFVATAYFTPPSRFLVLGELVFSTKPPSDKEREIIGNTGVEFRTLPYADQFLDW